MAARRFQANETTSVRDLTSTMKKMQATSLKIDRGDLLNDDITEVRIIFDRGGKRYVFKCDNYSNKLDNLRAAQLTISYLYRALEAYGVESTETNLANKIFENFLLGFEATPGDDVLQLTSGTEWYEILNVRPQATRQEIKNAYRALAKVHHPDNGGDQEQFKKLTTAYEKGMGQAQ